MPHTIESSHSNLMLISLVLEVKAFLCRLEQTSNSTSECRRSSAHVDAIPSTVRAGFYCCLCPVPLHGLVTEASLKVEISMAVSNCSQSDRNNLIQASDKPDKPDKHFQAYDQGNLI